MDRSRGASESGESFAVAAAVPHHGRHFFFDKVSL